MALLCRRRGTVCPHIVDWVNFARAYDDDFQRDARGDDVVLAYWHKAYELSGATKPECWSTGQLKYDGHTVSVSDLFYVAHHAGKASVHLGTVARLEAATVHSDRQEALPASTIVMCVGFETNQANADLVGASSMRAPGLVEPNLWVLAEPHLDGVMSRGKLTL